MTDLGSRIVPSLLARDLRETLRFYQFVLGFRLTGCQPNQEHPTWAEVSRDGVAIQFYAVPPSDTPASPIMSGALYIYPDDVRTLATELAARVPFEWGPEVMDYGLREFAVRDPNGYLLAFAEPADSQDPRRHEALTPRR